MSWRFLPTSQALKRTRSESAGFRRSQDLLTKPEWPGACCARQNRFYFPAGNAVINPIDARDLAAVALWKLLAGKSCDDVLNLTGPGS